MSLINQMLRDLDARQGEPAPAAAARSVPAPSRAVPRWTLVALLLAASVAAATWWFVAHRTGTAAGPQAPAATEKRPQSGDGKSSPAAAATASRQRAERAAPGAHLSAIISDNGHSLILTFSPALQAPVLAGPARLIRARIPASANVGALGAPPRLHGLEAFRLVPTPAGLLVVARAAPGYKVRLGPAPDATPLGAAIALDVIPPAARTAASAASAAAPASPVPPPDRKPASKAAKPAGHQAEDAPSRHRAAATAHARSTGTSQGSTRIQRVPTSPGERAAENYDRAMNALRNGDRGRAESLLRKALSDRPGYTDARVLLAAVLMQAKRDSEALQLLSDGIKRGDGNDSRLALLQARILAGERKLPAAVAALQRNAPPVEDDPAYHAQLAAYEEQAGQYRTAVTEYRSLVAQSPGNGRWWLGLAIALDQLGDDGADAAYRRALNAGGLPGKAAAYAQGRLKALGGHS